MSISKNILLSSNKKTSFLSTTLKSYLQEENFDVMYSGFDVDEVGGMVERPSLILLSFEDIEETDKPFLFYIKELCMKEETWVYLCGNENEIIYVASIIPESSIVDTCTRPFDIPKMINKMDKEIEKYISEQEKKRNLAEESPRETKQDINISKRILFLSNKSNFMTTTINFRLQQDDFEVMSSGFNIDDVSKMKNRPNLILINFENIVETDKPFLFYIRDLCIEEENRVYLCGNENEFDDIISILPKGAVMGTFARPFSMPEFINRMNKEVDRYKQDQGKKHILVVDDSGEMLQTIRTWLSDSYRVSIVNSGANAILFLANQRPDLILLDYEMPFCSGPQMMEMIRAESATSSIPIMFLTGKGDKESLKKVLALKPEGYMLKTLTPDQIKQTINKFFLSQKAKEFNKGI